jgi:excisionase family DNA binding protein
MIVQEVTEEQCKLLFTNMNTHPQQSISQNPGSYEPLIDDAEAARFLGGLHPKTVQRMARRGELPHYRVGKYYRYRASELNQWLVLQSQGQNPPAPTRKETIQ